MTLYYFLSSRILILKHCAKAWHLSGTNRCLNTAASRLLNRINTSQDEEEEEEEKAGPSAKHGHTEFITHRMGWFFETETKRVGVNQWIPNAEDFLRKITLQH